MHTYFSQSKLLWTPAQPATSAAEALRREINRKHGLNLSAWHLSYLQGHKADLRLSTENYYDLHKYSVEDYTFWLDLWDFLGIISSVPPQKVHERIRQPKNFN